MAQSGAGGRLVLAARRSRRRRSRRGLVTVVFRRFFVRMAPDELGRSRDELEAFAAEVFAPLRRSDQQGKGVSYLRGLLLGGRRKSMQPMASGRASTASACTSS
ncbi:hypothetical protein NRF20_45695 [Streptomyces sp. R-74717]|uniref:hypothetical protein n=1 Tax=Streptomyces sp. R-74717 TaxID=2969820 RepID=UPI0039B6BF7F